MAFWHSLFRASERNVTQSPNTYSPSYDENEADLFDHFGSLLSITRVDAEGFYTCVTQNGKKEGMGFTLELIAQTGIDRSVLAGLHTLVQTNLPLHTTVAVTLYADPNIEEVLDDYARSRQDHPLLTDNVSSMLGKMTRRRYQFLSAMTRVTAQSNFLLRNYRAFVSVIVPAAHATDQAMRRLRTQFASSLTEAMLEHEPLGAKRLLHLYRSICQPGRSFSRKTTHYNEHDEFRNQVMSSDVRIDIADNGIILTHADNDGDPYHGVGLVLHEMPRHWDIRHMNRVIGDPGRHATALPCPFLMTTWYEQTDSVIEETRFASELIRAKQMRQTPIAHFVNYYEERVQDLRIVQQDFKNGYGLVPSHMEVFFWSRASRVKKDRASFRTLLRRAGLAFYPARFTHMLSFLVNLPGQAGPRLAADAKKMKRLPRKTQASVLHLLPVLADGRGSITREEKPYRTPLLLLSSRRGQITPIDPFANRNGNFSATIVGKPGSGKSVIMNELALNILAQGGRCWIFDIGRSYEKIAHLLNGSFISLDENHILNMNPFVGLDQNDTEHVEQVVGIIEELIALEQPDGLVHQTLFSLVVRLAKEKRRPTLADLYDALLTVKNAENAVDQRFFDIARRLEPYAYGAFAPWMNNTHPDIVFDAPFVVLELEGLSAYPTLRNAILLQLMMLIERSMKEDRSIVKLVLLDEAWDLMRSRHAGRFIETGFRRARKLNGSYITATQNIADYFQSETASAAWQCADMHLYLRQDPQEIAHLEHQGLLGKDPWLSAAIRSLTTQRNQYSEMVVSVGDAAPMIGRLYIDRFTQWAVSTHASEFTRVMDLVRQGWRVEDAIEALMKEEIRMQNHDPNHEKDTNATHKRKE